jgi:squalene-associated FAD-dependent desaturase
MTGAARRVHIVGAGLAGLSCAVELAASSTHVTLYEAAGHAGGRCRSWHDRVLDRTIDNGNHLLLSGNSAAMDYLRKTGAGDALDGPPVAVLPFHDLATGEGWALRPNDGRLPWWLFAPSRRVAGAGAAAHLRGLAALARAPAEATVADALGRNPLYRRLWEPLAVAVMNTPAAEASARLLWRAVRETLGAGGQACRPLVARSGLGAAFVDPALRLLAEQGTEIRFGARLSSVALDNDRLSILRFADTDVTLATGEAVVLAVPPWSAGEILPGVATPDRHHTIVNAHFRLPDPASLPGGAPLLGLVGGAAQWLFARGDVVSVTVSAADALAERDNDAIAALLWADVAAALGGDGDAIPPHRIVKEKRATFAQTPEQAARRPGTRTALANLCLAGDWTDTGLPATIEGAIRSGQAAAVLTRDFAPENWNPATPCAT